MLRDHTEAHVHQSRLFLAKGRALGFWPGDGTAEGDEMAREERRLTTFLEHLERVGAEAR